MNSTPEGVEVLLAHNPDYPAFGRWLIACLGAPDVSRTNVR